MGQRNLILLSGAVAAGKTRIASLLEREHGFNRVSTSGHLKAMAARLDIAVNRVAMQDLGDREDIETDFLWPVTVAKAQMAVSPGTLWLLDAVRKRRQVHHFRAQNLGNVLHVHTWAPEAVLRARYEARVAANQEYGETGTYEEFVNRPNEVESRSLIELSDMTCDTSILSPERAVQLILDRLSGGAT